MCPGLDQLSSWHVQILFPASYSETAAQLRKAAISNEGTLRQCISQLQAALSANVRLQTLTARVEVGGAALVAAVLRVSGSISIGWCLQSFISNRQAATLGQAVGWRTGCHACPERCTPKPIDSQLPSDHLRDVDTDAVQLHGRTKSLFSAMRKILRLGNMAAGGRRLEQLHDLLGLRAIVQPRADLPEEEARLAAVEARFRFPCIVSELRLMCESRYRRACRVSAADWHSESLHFAQCTSILRLDQHWHLRRNVAPTGVLHCERHGAGAVAGVGRPGEGLHPAPEGQQLPEPAHHSGGTGAQVSTHCCLVLLK